MELLVLPELVSFAIVIPLQMILQFQKERR